jgi:hypothetical protein
MHELSFPCRPQLVPSISLPASRWFLEGGFFFLFRIFFPSKTTRHIFYPSPVKACAHPSTTNLGRVCSFAVNKSAVVPHQMCIVCVYIYMPPTFFFLLPYLFRVIGLIHTHTITNSPPRRSEPCKFPDPGSGLSSSFPSLKRCPVNPRKRLPCIPCVNPTLSCLVY